MKLSELNVIIAAQIAQIQSIKDQLSDRDATVGNLVAEREQFMNDKAGLEQRIAALEAKLADPDIELPQETEDAISEFKAELQELDDMIPNSERASANQ